jgi:polar amino acid transport system substrate-binding protein
MKLRDVLKTQNISLEVEFYPWERAQSYSKKPGYLGYFPSWPEEVSEGFIGSKAVDSSRIGVLTSSKKPISWSSVNALFQGNKVGLVGSYVYPQAIETAKSAHRGNVDISPDEMILMKKLSTGRIDAALTDPAVMMHLANENGISNIVALKDNLEEKPLVVSVYNGNNNKQKLELLNKLLSK